MHCYLIDHLVAFGRVGVIDDGMIRKIFFQFWDKMLEIPEHGHLTDLTTITNTQKTSLEQ
jgi:hypothetical protein